MLINRVDIGLLDYEVDIILEALLEYCEINNAKYNFRKISKTESESDEKFLIRNTYEHIQSCKVNKSQKIKNESVEELTAEEEVI